MKKYKRNDRFDKGRDFRSDGREDGRRSLLHKAVCDKCGNDCELPFKPTSGKPVFCSSCFEKNQSEDPRRSVGERGARKFSGRDSRDRDFSSRKPARPSRYVIVCDKCGEDSEVPFRPTQGKPVYCEKCFEGSGHNKEKSTELLKKEIEGIHKKLDKILAVLAPDRSKKAAPQEAEAETKDPKPKKKTKEAVTKAPAKKAVSTKKAVVTKTTVTKPAAAKKAATTKVTAKKPAAAKKATAAKKTVKKAASAKKTTKKT